MINTGIKTTVYEVFTAVASAFTIERNLGDWDVVGTRDKLLQCSWLGMITIERGLH